ncbi:MAG: cupin domain-containing protein [archaeon]|nr:cupin domain-containing protein [archaeon]
MNNLEVTKNPIQQNDIAEVEALKGIFRKTLAFNPDAMLCHFRMNKGAKVPLHNHIFVQIGYILSGKVRFFTENSEFVVKEGDSYVFGANEKHGADLLENSSLLEVFTPCRPEYKPE